MKYAILIYETPEQFAKREGPEAPAYWAAWAAYTEAVKAAGVMTGGAGLERPTSATNVRMASGKPQVQDGPYADSKDLLGGFYIVDVPNLDEAIKWASRAPVGKGATEVRPLLQMNQ